MTYSWSTASKGPCFSDLNLLAGSSEVSYFVTSSSPLAERPSCRKLEVTHHHEIEYLPYVCNVPGYCPDGFPSITRQSVDGEEKECRITEPESEGRKECSMIDEEGDSVTHLDDIKPIKHCFPRQTIRPVIESPSEVEAFGFSQEHPTAGIYSAHAPGASLLFNDT